MKGWPPQICTNKSYLNCDFFLMFTNRMDEGLDCGICSNDPLFNVALTESRMSTGSYCECETERHDDDEYVFRATCGVGLDTYTCATTESDHGRKYSVLAQIK